MSSDHVAARAAHPPDEVQDCQGQYQHQQCKAACQIGPSPPAADSCVAGRSQKGLARAAGANSDGWQQVLGSITYTAPVDVGQSAAMYMNAELKLIASAGRSQTGICTLSHRYVLFADWIGNAGGSTTCQSDPSQAPALGIAEQPWNVAGSHSQTPHGGLSLWCC